MNAEIANYIKHLRLGPIEHSWRRISEIIPERFPDFWDEQGLDGLEGDQYVGMDLCREAGDFLGIEELKD